ncbi:uncharacterized protein LOC123877742 [Maniola jurtina]|uniref:uncharacterized protein LOC123877742 n=1 Tax=Maniola jurtina TaxID=191418 RepID=UPI001E68E671|nr:uncharacterized protein LOC123877742 [Maniola jurtina]
MTWSNNVIVNLLDDLGSSSHDRYWQSKKKPLLLTTYDECRQCNIYSSDVLDMYQIDVWVSYINLNRVIRANLDCLSVAKKEVEPDCLKYLVINELQEKYKSWVHIYTDGSKNNMGLGAAFCHLGERKSVMFKTNQQICIMTMELVAISEALKYISGLSGQYFVIFSDSRSALQHLARCASGYSRGLPIAFEILKQIYDFRHINLRLQWVPSHIGLRGNEEADKLAKSAINVGKELSIVPFFTEILNSFKNKCCDKFKEYFDIRSREKGIWYKTIQCQPPRFPWFGNTCLSRKYISIIDVFLHRQ